MHTPVKEKIAFPELGELISKNDIFGVSETWLNEKDKINLPGYNFYPMSRKKEKGASRGGVGVFIKNEIKKHIKIRYDLSCENFLWCKLSKNYSGYHDDLYIGIVYIPPENSTRERKLNIDHFKCLKEITTKINSNNIILLGDFNARTKNVDDTLMEEKHDSTMPPNFYSGIKTKRCNQDLIISQYGKKLIEYCVATHSYIANGRTLGDLQGKLTCHQVQGSSTVDYAIINENMKRYVKIFQVLDPSVGSDHCPIKVELALPENKSKLEDKTKPILPQIRWNEKTKQIFQNRINSNEIKRNIIQLENILENNGNIHAVIKKTKPHISPDPKQ